MGKLFSVDVVLNSAERNSAWRYTAMMMIMMTMMGFEAQVKSSFLFWRYIPYKTVLVEAFMLLNVADYAIQFP